MKEGRAAINKLITTIHRSVAVWYVSYAILGAVTAALVPVLLPLMIRTLSHRLSDVGWVMGVYNLGILTSPFWGSLADKKHIHRSIFLGGFIILLMGLVAIPFGKSLPEWLGMAFVIGAGTAAIATVASLFVVEFNPQSEWASRIGWLQSFNGFGQTIGLLLAAVFSGREAFSAGLWTGAALLVPAIILGHFGLPTQKPGGIKKHQLRHLDYHKLAKFRRVEFLGGGIFRHSHHLNLSAIRNIGKLIPTAFGYFILSWFIMALGVAAFFAYFPLAMKSAYDMAPGITSLVYAVAGGVGIVLYTASTSLSAHFGVEKVYRWGLLLRLVGFCMLLALIFIHFPDRAIVASVAFALIILSWPILSVTGTTITADITPVSQGEAMGLFNASAAVGTVLGTFLGGPLVLFLGYLALSIMGVAGVAISLVLAYFMAVPAQSGDSMPPQE